MRQEYNKMQKEFIISFDKNYPDIELISMNKKEDKTINDIIILESNIGPLVAKIYNKTYDNFTINNSALCQRLLAEQGLAPMVYTNTSNNLVTSFGTYRYVLQEYIDGNNETNKIEIDKIAKKLSSLHNIMNNNQEKFHLKSKKTGVDFKNILKNIDREKSVILNIKENNTLYQEFIKLIDLREKMAYKYKLDYMPNEKRLIHADIRSSNIILNRDKIYFIDFDYLKSGDLLFEIGSSAINISNLHINDAILFVKKYFMYSDVKGHSICEVFNNLIAYYYQSSFPLNLVGNLDSKSLIGVIRSRYEALSFCDEILDVINKDFL